MRLKGHGGNIRKNIISAVSVAKHKGPKTRHGLNKNFEIELMPKHKATSALVDEHNNLYHISGVFNRHQDVAEDLLMKAVIYTNHLQKAHLKIQGLFPDRPTYRRYLIGNYSSPKETLKRPLTKFIQDISKQLKII